MEAIVWGATLFGSLSALFYQLFGRRTERPKRSLKLINQSVRLEKQLDGWLAQNEKAQQFTEKTSSLLKRSRIRIGGRPLNKYVFFLILAISAIIVCVAATQLLSNFIAGILLGFITGYLFFYILSWDGKHRKRSLRKQAPNFFLTLNNFYEVHNDILLALKDTVKKIKNPLKTDLEFLIGQLQNGDTTLRESIIETKKRLDMKMMQDFLDDIELQIKFGGNFSTTIKNYIEDSIEHEIRIMERSSETAGASLVTYFLFGVFFVMAFAMNKTQPEAMHLLVTHTVGKAVVVAIIIIMLAVLYITKELTEVEEE